MFYYDFQWFYQDFKSENFCSLNLYSVQAARIPHLSLEIILSPPNEERSTCTTLNTGIIFLFFKS